MLVSVKYHFKLPPVPADSMMTESLFSAEAKTFDAPVRELVSAYFADSSMFAIEIF